jgi:hypothetical protein
LTDAFERVISALGSSDSPLGRTTLTTWFFQDGILEKGERKMSVIIEKRDVNVNICDLCHQEVGSLSKCVICKRDMCNAGTSKHTSHTLDVYSFKLENNICSAHVCNECAEKKTDLTIGQLLDGMFAESPVSTINGAKDKFDYLLELAINLGFVTVEQAAQADDAAGPEQSVIDVLLKRKLITQAQIAQAKAAQFGAEVVNLKDMVIRPDVIAVVSSHIARKYRIIPIEKGEEIISIAIADPSDLNTIDSLTHLLNAEIKLFVASEEDIALALDKYYPAKTASLIPLSMECPTCGHELKHEGTGLRCSYCSGFFNPP